jgi:hypothetical protein
VKTANRLVALALALACVLAAPLSAVAEPVASESPSWSFSGVHLSATRVTSGEPVTVTPRVIGDLDGATYNYVWSYEGGWDLWGSTVRDTGKGTSDASSELTLARAGTYTLYVDVTDRSGQKRTMSATLEVAPPSWEFSGVHISATRVTSGEAVTVTPITSGDLDGATYNYVWSYGGGWDLWGSTVKDEGKATTDTTGTLSFYRPGRYVLYVDVTDRAGETRTMSAVVEVASPSWSFTGVKVSSSRVRVDEPVTVTPATSGDLGGAEYNYVWSYEGGWDLWGSTVKDEGKATAEATGTLSLSRPGRYVVYVDVTDRSGQKRTMSAGVEAYDDSWSLGGVDVSAPSVTAGDEVTYSPRVSGDASGLRYNYVWQWDGSWAEGDWGSTELYTGSDTKEASHTGALGTPGRYTLYVDAVSQRGERRTASAQVVAWGVTGVSVSGSAASGWTASADLFEGHEVPGTLYRFRWASADGSASGTLSDWSGASSIWFSASTLGDSGDFRIVMDAKYPNGKTSTLTSDTVTYLTRAQRAVVDSAYKTSSYMGVSGWCAAWVSKVFAAAGYGWYGGDANDMYWAWCHSSNLSDLRAGMVIAVDKSPTRLGRLYGHIGVYVGNGLVHDDEGYVREMTLRDWLNFYSQAGQPKWGWAGNVSLV